MTADRPETPTPTSPSEPAPASGRNGSQAGQGIDRLARRLPGGRARRVRPTRSVAIPREQLAELLAALGDSAHPRHAAAVDDLVRCGAAALPALCEALTSQGSWLLAYRAAEAAGQIGDGRAVGALVQALQHPNSNVRWSAVRALSQIGDMRSMLELRRVAEHDHGRTSWGELVADTAQSALDQIRRHSIWGQSLELLKTAVACVLMILSLILAFSVTSTLRGELENFGQQLPGQELQPLLLPTIAPTAAAAVASAPTATPEGTDLAATAGAALPTTTPLAGDDALTGSVLQQANVRASPATDNEPIGRVSRGDEVIFIGRSENSQWYLVRLGAKRAATSRIDNPDGSEMGWVNRALVSTPRGELPIVQANGAVLQPTPIP